VTTSRSECLLRSEVGETLVALLNTRNARRATLYVFPNLVVRSTRRHKYSSRASREEFVVTIGKPNYEEKKVIKALVKAKVSFPNNKVLLKSWPQKKLVD
jgi:hypothetical protein